MYRGSHAKKSKRKTRKPVIFLASAILLVCALIGGTMAYLLTNTDAIKNTFTQANVTTSVSETLDGTTKSNVKIKNTGNVEAWIRACVVVTWQDAAGNVYGTAPVEETDYSIEYSNTGWLRGNDGFWYCTSPVAPEQETVVLISSCTYTANAPDGYTLNVEIIGSGIQSKPTNVFTESWSSSGLTIENDILMKGGGDA